MKKRLFYFFIIVILSFSLPGYMFFRGFSKAADTYASTEANQMLTYIVNESIYKKISDSGFKYEDFAIVKTDLSGKITSIQIDTVKLNLLSSELVLTIIDRIKNIDDGEFGIPLGNAFGSRLFSGKGPEIKVTIKPLGTVANEIKSVFLSAGINQSLHRIVLEYKICVSLMTPFTSSSSQFTASLCIAETVIVGNVPNVIWGLGDSSGNLKGNN